VRNIVQNIELLPYLKGLLPEEILQKILSGLIKSHKINDLVLERLLGESVRNIELDDCHQITDLCCKNIATFCNNLRRISLNGCIRVGNESLVQISLHCQYLEVIQISGCVNVENLGVQEIAKKFKYLVSADLSGCEKITDTSLIELLSSCIYFLFEIV